MKSIIAFFQNLVRRNAPSSLPESENRKTVLPDAQQEEIKPIRRNTIIGSGDPLSLIENWGHEDAESLLSQSPEKCGDEDQLLMAICHYQLGHPDKAEDIIGALIERNSQLRLEASTLLLYATTMTGNGAKYDIKGLLSESLGKMVDPNSPKCSRLVRIESHIAALAQCLSPISLKVAVEKARQQRGLPLKDNEGLIAPWYSEVKVKFSLDDIPEGFSFAHLSCSWHRLYRLAPGNEVAWSTPLARQFFGHSLPLMTIEAPESLLRLKFRQERAVLGFFQNGVVHWVCNEEYWSHKEGAQEGTMQSTASANTPSKQVQGSIDERQEPERTIGGWMDLGRELRRASARQEVDASKNLESTYPYQSLFWAFLSDAARSNEHFFRDIPFTAPPAQAIDRAQAYADDPPLPKMYKMMMDTMLVPLGHSMPGAAKYRLLDDGKETSRTSNEGLDRIIISVAAVLKGRQVQAIGTQVQVAAFDAIKHYADLPVVRYFASLPCLRQIIENGAVASPGDMLLFRYRVTEGLIYELYDELQEGEVITDERITRKVRDLLA